MTARVSRAASRPSIAILHELAGQDVKRRISNCFVALDDLNTIAGFYTLAAASVSISELPDDLTKRLPRYPLLPAALVGRLAIDEKYRGQRIGSALIVEAITRALHAEPAIFALIVDAKDGAAVRFYEHLGFRRFVSKPQSLFLPMATVLEALRART